MNKERPLTDRERLTSGRLRHDDGQARHPDDKHAWIQTFRGHKFFPLDPVPDEVDIEDVAQALSNLCRFAGHTKSFYSVAQHSVLVSHHCSPENALWGLLHDASEAYLLDMPRPLKRHWSFAGYRKHEVRLEACIAQRFGLIGSKMPADVKDADMRVWAAECRDLMGPLHPDFRVDVEPIEGQIKPLLPLPAKTLFLKRYLELIGG